MLFLQYAADGSAESATAPLDDAAAVHLERALLAGDDASRLHQLQAALAANGHLASWALRMAEARLGRTVNRIEDAARWLTKHLATELASALVCDDVVQATDCVGSRLPALARRLSDCEFTLAEFEKRVEREKLDAMKELAYGASHEINNPLANIAARAQTLLEDEADPQRRQKLIAIHRQAMRAHEMIADLMLFARPPKRNLATLNLHDQVRDVVRELTPLAAEFNAQLAFTADEIPVEVVADGTQIGVAVQAVVKNALEAVGDGGRVVVTLRQHLSDDKHCAEIIVRDDGPGVSDEVRRHMFDPFFSGREAGRGLGFGLSKCWRIVTDHGGYLIVQQPSIGGTEIAIRLPLSPAVERTASARRYRC